MDYYHLRLSVCARRTAGATRGGKCQWSHTACWWPWSRPLWRAIPRAPRARTRPPSRTHPRDGSRRADRARRARWFTGKRMDASRWYQRPAQRSATVARATLRARLCHLGAMPSRCSAGVRRVRPTFTTHSRRTTPHESLRVSHSETSILKFGSRSAGRAARVRQAAKTCPTRGPSASAGSRKSADRVARSAGHPVRQGARGCPTGWLPGASDHFGFVRARLFRGET